MEAIERPAFERAVASRLVTSGKLDQAAIDRVSRLQTSNNERLEALLVKLGLASERDVADALADELGLVIAQPSDYPDTPLLDDRLTPQFLRHVNVLPLDLREDTLVLAMIDPLDTYATRAIEMACSRRIVPRIALPSDLETAFTRLYDSEKPLGHVAEPLTETGADEDFLEDVGRLRDLASEVPVIRLVNQLISRAVESGASDIHIESLQSRMIVRYRIDGILREVDLATGEFARRDHLARQDHGEAQHRRAPPAARRPHPHRACRGANSICASRPCRPCTANASSCVSSIATVSCVDLAVARLRRDAMLAPFLGVLRPAARHSAGHRPDRQRQDDDALRRLIRLNSPERKLFTVEDPIEYQLEGVNQIQVKPQIGLTFAHVLRSILRQDPDIIMVGEMRDLETAQIAVQAALTGHLVLSTLHTNNAAATMTRLLDMGVEDYLVTSTVNGVLAQRLVRKLCTHCREPYRRCRRWRVRSICRRQAMTAPTLYHARGCEHCLGSGYFGRVGVLEFLPLTDELRRARPVACDGARYPPRRRSRKACARCMTTASPRRLQGVTSLEEVIRVTRDI